MIAGSPLPAIIDTHAHLDDAAFDCDRGEVLADAARAGVSRIINIGYNPSSWQRSRALQERYPQVALALGLHPQEASTFEPSLIAELARLVAEVRPLAIGETGIELSRRRPALDEQERAFRAQLELAMTFRLPVVIHQRAAVDELIAVLDRSQVAPIVLHSFDGNQRLMDWAIDRGCFFGIGGLALKSAAVPLRNLLQQAPIERLLLETDSPYLAPPGTGQKRNTPANLPRMAASLAPLWELSPAELCRATTTNATGLFGLEPS